MTEKRSALIIASCQYQDESLRQLIAPPHDAEALAQVLSDPTIGDFEVQTILNESSYKVKQEIEAFFDDCKRDDLLLFYFSGHGIKNGEGRLYFATSDTNRKRLRSTAIPATFVNDVMQFSYSRRQVLFLDCCYSGAFAKGIVAKADKAIGIKEYFKGRGKVVLTASDALQYAFEGDKIVEEGVVQSIFTRTLVRGLKTGEADLNCDGVISLDELYEYVYDHTVEQMPQQHPMRWAFNVQGEIIIARNPKAPRGSLPMWVTLALASPDLSSRIIAINELCRMAQGQDLISVNLAHAELERLSSEDSDPIVRKVASAMIGDSLTRKDKKSSIDQLSTHHALIKKELMDLRSFWHSLDFLPGDSQRARGSATVVLPSGDCNITLDIVFPVNYPESPPIIDLNATGAKSNEIKSIKTSLRRKISSSWVHCKKTSEILKRLPEDLIVCLIGRDEVTSVDFREEVRRKLPIYYCKQCMNKPSRKICYFHKSSLDIIVERGRRCILYPTQLINEEDVGILLP